MFNHTYMHIKHFCLKIFNTKEITTKIMVKTLLILLVNEKYFFVTDIKQITVIATFWYYNCELQSQIFLCDRHQRDYSHCNILILQLWASESFICQYSVFRSLFYKITYVDLCHWTFKCFKITLSIINDELMALIVRLRLLRAVIVILYWF